MIRRSKKIKIIFLFASVLTITLCHYVTELKAHHYHLVYQGFYFLPIMLAGFWFGLRGALSTSLSIIIDVSDSGCGIPIDKKEEIFSPFFTTKENGTGLGLPIAKKIVEAHEGCLEVLENPERGVTFRGIIPF